MRELFTHAFNVKRDTIRTTFQYESVFFYFHKIDNNLIRLSWFPVFYDGQISIL